MRKRVALVTSGLGKLTASVRKVAALSGSRPQASLIQGSDGNFYGTTNLGGAYNYGTVFKITPKGKLTTLHSFDEDDGAIPTAPLIQATDSNFYGTVSNGNGHFAGAVFEITSAGTFTELYQFVVLANGLHPDGGLTQDTNGDLYGTTATGGNGEGLESGTAFELAMGSAPS